MQENSKAIAIPQTRGQQFLNWLEDPLGQVVAASVATIGSFGVVLSGIWFMNLIIG